MNVTENCPTQEPLSFAPRRRDRRRGLTELLSALARHATDRSGSSSMRGAFEDLLRDTLAVRAVRLRDAGSRWVERPDLASGLESFVLDVPGPPQSVRGVMETAFEPGCRLDEWDFQTLGMAAQIAALVLEIDRGRLQPHRTGALAPLRPRRDGAAPLIGSTPAMAALRSRIERVAGTDFTVLLEGESGVGKELVARQIHDLSRRRNGPFVAVNCAALVETLIEAELFGIEERTATGVRGRRGKFEHADKGTLFLDEVSELSPPAQAKLLRAIQDLAVERVGGTGTHPVDIRIVAATNQGLAALVDQRLLRPDLFYRLSGVDIRVPPLRERRADILELARYFLERHRPTRLLKLSDAASEALFTYDWPGNVRELERLIEGAVALVDGDVIQVDDLPLAVSGEYATVLMPSAHRNETMRAWGSRYARLMLGRCKGNKRETCRLLGISYHTLASYLTYGAGTAKPASDEALNQSTEEKDAAAVCAADA